MSTTFATASLSASPDAASAAQRMAQDSIDVLHQAVERSGLAHLAVSGGSLATRVMPAIIAAGNAAGLDWAHVHIWFVDERFVPRGTEDRNASTVVAAVRAAASFPADQLHIMPSSDLGLTLSEAASEYEQRLIRHVAIRQGDGLPSLDLALLGMGPDGHTASLFPGQLPAESSALVVPVDDSPKPPPQRLSLSYRALDAAQHCWVYATGAEKHEALTLARSGSASAEASPVSRVCARREVRLYADAAAIGGDIASD